VDSASLQQFILLVILLIFAGFFSISETALTSINKIKLINMIENDVRGAKTIDKVTKDKSKLLSSLLLGNNLVTIGASVLATSITINFFGNNTRAITTTTITLTIIVVIFCDIIPKVYATHKAEKVSLFISKPVKICIAILSPVVYFFTIITSVFLKLMGIKEDQKAVCMTEDDLKSIVNVGHEEGAIETNDKEMINNVFGFGNYDAKDVMTPRTDLASIPNTATYDEVKSIFKEDYFSRIPIYKDNIDQIIGILHIKDFIFSAKTGDDFNLEEIMREALFTYESKSIKDLFHLMRVNSISIAVILDEYGGTAGIVSIEDLVEQIVGEINDEYDDEEVGIEIIQEKEYVVEGITRIEDVNEVLDIKIKSEDFDSIGGYVIGLIGHIPENGHVVEHHNIKFVIEVMDKNRVEKIRIYT
jgi:putative hemolysin